ncbi:MAG: hypothetical protein ACLS8R_09650 [Anaeromassilibacillus sp.]
MDDCLCEVKLDIAGLTIQVKNDYSGDKTFFDVQASLYAEAVAYQPAEVTVVTDAYSKAYELEIGYQQKTLEQVVELLNDSTIQKSSISLEGTGISKVFDIWNELSSVTAAEQDGQIVYKGNLTSAFWRPTGEPPVLYRAHGRFEYAHPWGRKSQRRSNASPGSMWRVSATASQGMASRSRQSCGLKPRSSPRTA